MRTELIKKIPQAKEIKDLLPLDAKGEKQIAQHIKDIENILSGDDDRVILIVGPCSAWPAEALLDYARKIKKLSEQPKAKEKLKIILRVYTQKPRTSKGWKGPLNQPDPFAPADIEAGIKYVRSLMLEIIKIGLPIADELLFTHTPKFFLDLISYAAIGARSSEDQEHRIFASALPCAVGLKNPTSGSIELGTNSIISAQESHVAIFLDKHVRTHGNPFAHLILRGGAATGPNYHLENLYDAKESLAKSQVLNPAVVIDASHDNSVIAGAKDHTQQINVVHEVLDNLKNRPELKKLVRGFMVESFLKDGRQAVDDLTPQTIDKNGLSITDACLGWDSAEKLIEEIVERI